ncbi:hypothetical protein [Gaetbulibacter jejuensis]|uniref:hypothetical protein n=1 Tax=Gaetbulibacter jejuensis TaxID=584607 RepID=UPI00300AE2A8
MHLITKPNIKKYYRTIGYINLVFSILLVILINDIELIERFYALVAINVGYHMLYYFYSGIYNSTKKMRSLNSFNKNIGGIMLGVFAMFGILASFFLVYTFIIKVFLNNEFISLFALCLPFGLLFGAYSLWLDITEE